MIKNILFDLDGTLLPMDNEVFLKYYFKLLLKKMVPLGYDGDALVKDIMKATYKVLANDGTMTNEERFFKEYESYAKGHLPFDMDTTKKLFDEFYEKDFDEAKSVLNDNKNSLEFLEEILNGDYKVIVATSPVFPKSAVNKRLNWLGKSLEDFDYVTTYENSTYCKPNPLYYKELIDKLALEAEETIMIGNDLNDDIYPALKNGLKVFYLNDYPINDDPKYDGPKGSFDDLEAYLKSL